MSRRWLGWAVGGGIVAILLIPLDVSTIGATLAQANVALVVVGVAGLTATHVLGAVTWRSLTRRLGGIVLGWRTAIRLTYAGQALGGITPANLGSDAYRAAVLRPATESRTAAIAPIVLQRATSWVTLGGLGLAALGLVAVPAEIPVPALIVGAALAGLGLTAIGVGWLRRHPGALSGVDGRVARRATLIGLVGGLAFHLVAIGCGYVLVLAVDPVAAVVAPAVIGSLAVARVSLLVPLTPSGLGVGEAALAILFAGIGLAPETAIAAALLARLGLVVTTLVGSIALAASSGSQASWTRVQPSS